MRRYVLLLSIALWISVVFVGTAAAQQTVTSCGTLDQDGTTYVLESNLNDQSSFECINIDGDDITFDGQGYTLSSSASGTDSDSTGIKVAAGGFSPNTGVVIRNVTLEGWRWGGIELRGDGTVVEDVTVRNVEGIGIEIDAGFIGSSNTVRDSVVDGVTATDRGDGIGIDSAAGSSSTSNTLRDIEIRNTDGVAHRTDNDLGDTIVRHDLTGNLTSMEANNLDVDNVPSPPPQPADSDTELGTYVSIEDRGTSSLEDLSLYYDSADVGAGKVPAVWYYNGSWERLDTRVLGSDSGGDFAEVERGFTQLPSGSVFGAFTGDPLPPNASFTFDPSNPVEGEQVTFDASGSSSPNDEVSQYRWDFEGDGTFDETTTSDTTTHVYSDNDTYTATLEIEDGVGETNSTTRTVVVDEPGEPNAEFTFSPNEPLEGEQVTFDASGSSSPNGDVSEYRWDFDGDGTFDETTTSDTTTNTYTENDTYTVTLEIEDEVGATNRTQDTITVLNDPAPDCTQVSYSTDTDGALLVENVDQLQCMNESLSEDYRLANDIDATGTSSWNGGKGFDPVGPDPSTPFTGTLDGDGHVVTGLSINRGEGYIGLFGATDDAVVRDLGMEEVSIENSLAFFVGALAGQINRTEVHDTEATGNISVSCCAGGIVGEALVDSGASAGNLLDNVRTDVDVEAPDCCAGGLFYVWEGGTIVDSSAEGDVKTSNSCCVGGIGAFHDNDGSFESVVRNTYATGDISDEFCCSGGFIAEIFDSGGGRVVVEDSYATGNVSSNDCCVGGFSEFVGDDTVIRNSYATGSVSSTFCCSGGFAAYTFDNVVIEESYATGDVTDGDCCVGGFTGGLYENTVIRDSFSTGDVEGQFCCVGGFFGDGDTFGGGDGVAVRSVSTGNVEESGGGDAGGFAGYNDGINITESYSTGNAESDEDNVGGFIGYVEGGAIINESYARGDATGNDTVGGFAGILNSGEIDEAYSVGVPTATNPSATEVGGFIARDETTGGTSVAATNERRSEERDVGTEASVPENVPSDAPVSEETHPVRNKELTDTTDTDGTVTTQQNGVTDSYWDEEASGTSDSDSGTPLSTDEMTDDDAPDNMFGFDFVNTWVTVTEDYPILQNSPDLPGVEKEVRDEERCVSRRSVSRGQESQKCPTDRGLSRGGSRENLDREYGRNSDTARRDRGRDSTRRSRGRGR